MSKNIWLSLPLAIVLMSGCGDSSSESNDTPKQQIVQTLSSTTYVVVQNGVTKEVCDAQDVAKAEYDNYDSYEEFTKAGGVASTTFYTSSQSCSSFSNAGKCEELDLSAQVGGKGSCVYSVIFPTVDVESTTQVETTTEVVTPKLQGKYSVGDIATLTHVDGDNYVIAQTDSIRYASFKSDGSFTINGYKQSSTLWEKSESNLKLLKAAEDKIIVSYSGEYGTKQNIVEILSTKDGSLVEKIVFDFGEYFHISYVSNDGKVFVGRLQTQDAHVIVQSDSTVLHNFKDTDFQAFAMNDKYIIMRSYTAMKVYDINGKFLWEKDVAVTQSNSVLDENLLYFWSYPRKILNKMDLFNGDLMATYETEGDYAISGVFTDGKKVYVNESGFDSATSYAISKVTALEVLTLTEAWKLKNRNILNINRVKNQFYTSGYYSEIGSLENGVVKESTFFKESNPNELYMNSDGTFYSKAYDFDNEVYTYSLYE